MSEARVTKVYKNNTAQNGFVGVPFGLTGDYISMHSGINLERQLKIGPLKNTFILKDSNRGQTKIYEIYLDGSQEYSSYEAAERKDKCYITETVIGNEAFIQYLTTSRGQKITTTNGKALSLFGKIKEQNEHFATITLYLGAIKNENQSFISTNPQLQQICQINGEEYYGVPISIKEILKSNNEMIQIKEVYKA